MGQVPDVWRAVGGPAGSVFFDMLDGGRVADVLGLSDPDVHWIEDRWVMFLGGFTTRFRVRLFQAELPPGAGLDSDEWVLRRDPRRPRRALPLVHHVVRGQWDSAGMHTPCYVRATTSARTSVERIYYAGRATARFTGPGSRYAIGVLERRAGTWVRLPGPILRGDGARPSALEPRVCHAGNRWRMWYLAAVGEVGRGEQPDYEMRYVESVDGLGAWTTPRTLFPSADGFFDNAVTRVDGHWEMVLARGTNLHGTVPYPSQGLWWARSATASGDREAWSPGLIGLLDTDIDPEPWFARGTCGPSFHYGQTEADRDTMYLFVTGTRATAPWWRLALRRLARLRLPPVPAPYYLATGRITLPRVRRLLVEADASPPREGT